LVEQRIIAVDAEPFCLSLTFENGAQLRIFSDDGPYECGTINPADGGRGMIVF
jgi:hypothetical protein